jgi:hypothetical protein
VAPFVGHAIAAAKLHLPHAKRCDNAKKEQSPKRTRCTSLQANSKSKSVLAWIPHRRHTRKGAGDPVPRIVGDPLQALEMHQRVRKRMSWLPSKDGWMIAISLNSQFHC